MLKDWILNIKENSHYFHTNKWKYRISGNVLEFYVTPELVNQKREYRCAVITVGQILRSISNKAEKSGSACIIQSFPSLEAPEIIASIRVEDRVENSENPFPILNEELFNYSGEEKLRAISELYHFDIVKSDSPFETKLNFHSLENKAWYVISSKQDNPFTWLNLGSWKETLQYISPAAMNIESIHIFDLCNRVEWKRIQIKFPIKDHLQALIAINN